MLLICRPAGDRLGLASPCPFGPDCRLLIHVSHLSGRLPHGAGHNLVEKRMSISRRSIALAIAVALTMPVSAAPGPAYARDNAHDRASDHDGARRDQVRRAVEAGEIKSLAEILNIVKDKLPGDVAGVEIEHDDGKWLYEFRVVDDKGRLYEVYIDARSGAIERIKEK
jgi:uncharacterized membrane protein YkoI